MITAFRIIFLNYIHALLGITCKKQTAGFNFASMFFPFATHLKRVSICYGPFTS